MSSPHVCNPDQGTPTHQLTAKNLFGRLTKQEKLYAHHLSRAAWHGSRIVMRQTSPESVDIFDFIIDVYHACEGKWATLVERCGITSRDLEAFLEYAALFLCNLGNYFGEGDQKFIPDLSAEVVTTIASVSATTQNVVHKIINPLFAVPPFSPGFPSENAQSNYYPGDERITREEVAAVATLMERESIEPENTRLRKITKVGWPTFEVLQASAESALETREFQMKEPDAVHVVAGDHAPQMSMICSSLGEAKRYTANERQAEVLSHYVDSFQTGNMLAFRESQKQWVADRSPTVENMIGFVEPYRDPHGRRAEWEGVICVSDADETEKSKRFVAKAVVFIRLLLWAVSGENDGKGPFEKNSFEPPDFTSLYSLAFCASMVWEAANLPNYNDIREAYSFKNVIIANRMSANQKPTNPCHYVAESEKHRFRECIHLVRFVTTAVHELLGHGTGKLLSETATGVYNFDRSNMPINPLTNEPVKTWYLPGQMWTGVFEDIAPSVEECRATLVSQYLIDVKELLAIFGYDDATDVRADEILYYTYLEIGVAGLRSLDHFNVNDQKWGEAHSRGNFAIFKHLLVDGNGLLTVEYDAASQDLTVNIDRSKIITDGKPALGRLLCRLHVWRCIADVASCKVLYDELTTVGGRYEEWRQIVSTKKEPRWKFVQANTILNGERVDLKVYDESNEGIIQSWAERDI